MLAGGLDPFRDHRHPEGLAQGDDGPDDLGVLPRCAERADERAIDLERVQPEALEIAERAVPGAEVVHLHLQAELLEPLQDPDALFGLGHDGGLGDLESEAPGRERALPHDRRELGHQFGALELPGGEIDAHRERAVVRTPFEEALEGPRRLRQHPPAQGVDQSALLGQGDEIIGPEESTLRMTPARERFETYHPVGRQRHDRLVEEDQLLPFDGAAQVGLELELAGHVLAHPHLEELMPGLPRPLGRVHRRVGIAKEVLGAVITARDGDPDADRTVDLLAGHDERGGEHRLDPARDHFGLVDGVDLLQEHHELVTPQPRHRVAVPGGLFEPLGELPQQLVPLQVAERIVDHLEAVEVEEEHRAMEVGAAPHPTERMVEPVHEEGAVRQVGERIVEGVVEKLLLRGLALLDVRE